MYKCFLSILLFCLTVFVNAETKRFGAPLASSGIPYTDVNNVIEDSYGFLWISTLNGLVKYDGSTYVKYLRIKNNTNSLPSNVCFKSFEDSKNRLWVCTAEGLSYYDRERDNFEQVRFKGLVRKGVFSIFEDEAGFLWLLGSEALIKFSPDRKDTTFFKGIWGKEMIDLGDEIWLASLEKGMTVFNKRDQTFLPLNATDAKGVKISLSSSIYTVFLASDSTVFLGSMNRGFYHLSVKGEVLGHHLPNQSADGIISHSVCSFFEDGNHNVWIGSVNGNIALFSLEKRRYERLSYQLPDNIDPNNVTVSCILQDSHDNFWLSTHRFWMLSSNSVMDAFLFYQKNKGENVTESLSDNVISSFEQYGDRILIGTDGGGLTYFSNEDGFLGHDSKFSKVILNIEAESDTAVWFSTWGNGLIKYNPITKKKRVFSYDPNDENTLPTNRICGVYVEDTCIWVATDGAGIAKLDKRTGKIYSTRNSTSHPFGLTTPHYVYHIMRDSKQRLWISSSAGLACYTNNDEYTLYTYSDKEGSLSQNEIVMCYEDKKGRLWVVSETGGLDLFNEQTRSFVSYSDKMGIPHDLRSIVEDHQGNLWIGAIDAVYLFNPDENILKQYDLSIDLKGNTLSKRAAMVDKDNNLFLGTSNGFFRVNPKDIKPSKVNPYVYLKGFYLWDKKQEIGSSSILDKDIAFEDTITLKYEDNFFSIEFTSINLDVHESLKYFYKLEGFHPQWLPSDNQQKVSFTNLNPGTYKFHVKACTQEGVCNEASHPLTIVILPPWWKTWWFNCILGIVVCLIVFSIVQIRLSILNKKKEELEKLVEARTEEIAKKTEEIQLQKENLERKNQRLDEALSIKNKIMSVIAHDLKNPLTVVVGMLSYLLEDKTVAASEFLSKQISSITRSSKKLQEQMENLLQWSRLQNENIFYSPENVFLDTLVKDCVSLLHEFAKEKGILVSFSTTTQRAAYVDGRMVATVIRNILSNAIKFTPKRGVIDIVIEETEKFLKLSVKDSGVGMTEEQKSRLFNKKYNISTNGTENEKGSGLGLNICHDFVMSNKGEINVTSVQGEGTTVTVLLPKGEAVKSEHIRTESLINAEKNEITGKSTILFVDDNPDVISYLSLLFQNNYNIETADNGSDGLQKAISIVPDIIISDVVMPRMDGIQMCAELKKNVVTQHIPVIMLTAEDSNDSQLAGLNLGADDYLIKPFNNEILIAKVRTLLQNKERQRAFLRTQIMDMPADKMPENREDAFLRKVAEILQNNISESELSVEFLAEKTALSRVQLFRKFKAITGCSPSEYIKMFRLQYAATMLASGKYSVADVAFQVGYSDPKYFSTCFAERYGMSPSQYAKSSNSK